MQPSLFAHDEPDNRDESERTSSTNTPPDPVQITTAAIVASVVALMVADMIAHSEIVPVEGRLLALLAALGAVQIYLHRLQMAAIRARTYGEEYIAGYVDGIGQRPPRPGRH